MQEVARDVLVDLLLQPPVPLTHIGSALAQYAPVSVKAAFHSVVDTMKWLLTEEPSEAVLDMEVMRALQQNFQARPPEDSESFPSLTKTEAKTEVIVSESPRRRRPSRVHWSPTCESINADGEKETSPIRSAAECRAKWTPETSFFNLSLFPLISTD